MSIALYMDHQITKYTSLKECLNQNLLHLDVLNNFHKYQDPQSVGEFFHSKKTERFGLFTENSTDYEDGEGTKYTKVVEILKHCLQREHPPIKKIMVGSILRSKYDISLELLSAVSNVPLAILKTGINGPRAEKTWNDISSALDKIVDKQVYFLDWPEPPTLNELLEQIYRSRVDDRLYTFLISGISNLREFNED